MLYNNLSVKTITFLTKPIVKAMKHLIKINKINYTTLVKSAVNLGGEIIEENKFNELKLRMNDSYNSLKSRGFSFNKIIRENPKKIVTKEIE